MVLYNYVSNLYHGIKPIFLEVSNNLFSIISLWTRVIGFEKYLSIVGLERNKKHLLFR